MKKAKPDLIVIKKKKLIAKHAIGSVSGDNINSANPSIGTDNDESKETKNFVPSPELSEDFSHTSITHDTYPVSMAAIYFIRGILYLYNEYKLVRILNTEHWTTKGSDLSENNPSNFVPSTNPLIITQTYAPAIAGVRQKYHSHIGRLPMWPYPYENIDSKFKWKILSPEQSHKDDGKILFPTEETTVSGKSTIYSEYPSKTTSSAPNSLHQPFAYDAPISSFSPLPTPFSYTTTRKSQTSDIEPTRDNRLPPWMEMLHIKNNEYDAFKAPIEYYAKAIQNQPNHALINHQPHYGFTHIDKKYYRASNIYNNPSIIFHILIDSHSVLWHSVFKFLATAVPIGLVISALSPNVVTVNADSSPYVFCRHKSTNFYLI